MNLFLVALGSIVVKIKDKMKTFTIAQENS